MPFLATDAATTSLGAFGEYGNLSCLALVIILVAFEVLKLRPDREAKERDHQDKMATAFQTEVRDQRQVYLQTICDLRTEFNLQRQSSERQAERTAEAIAALAAAVQTLRIEISHVKPSPHS